MTFEELFHQYAAISFDRQLSIVEQIGDWSFELDPKAGEITFTKKRIFGSNKVRTSSVQILGSESQRDHSWLWGWANQSGLGEKALKAANRVQQIGSENGIPEFTTASQSVLDTGHALSLTVAGMFGKPGYYRCPYKGGAAFVMLEDASFMVPAANPVLRIAQVFPQLIETFKVADHRTAFESYLLAHELDATSKDDRVEGRMPDGQSVSAIFDDARRLTSLHAEAKK